MSEQNLINKHPLSEPIAELLREIQQTPEEYWPNLLQMIRLFRETVTMKPTSSDTWQKAMDEIKAIDPVQQHEAISKLIQSWVDEGDEQEQTETAEILRTALDERIQKNQGAIELLRSWEEEGDEQEQTETWEYLRKALDEDRLSNRPLFP